MKEQPFYIGQKVIALDSGTAIKKDQIYTVIGLLEFSCGCWGIDVGVTTNKSRCWCGTHKSIPNIVNGKRYYNARYFAPIQESFEKISFTRVIETEEVCVN